MMITMTMMTMSMGLDAFLAGGRVINDEDKLVLDATTNLVTRCIAGREEGDNDDNVVV